MDSQTKTRCKKAIREIWTWSKTYKDLIDSANYTCMNCGKKYTNKSKLYAEHLIALELQDYSTLEEYYWLMRDLNNLEVWGKECCKELKDQSDRAKIKKKKSGEML